MELVQDECAQLRRTAEAMAAKDGEAMLHEVFAPAGPSQSGLD